MNAEQFLNIYNDKHFYDFRRLGYKYGQSEIANFHNMLKEELYLQLPIKDYAGQPVMLLPAKLPTLQPESKKIAQLPNQGIVYSLVALDKEIKDSLQIENITKDSCAKSCEYKKINMNMKAAFEFISNKKNKITEANISKLYKIAIEPCLHAGDKLESSKKYRQGPVYIVGSTKIEKTCLAAKKLGHYMKNFVQFINATDQLDDLNKAALVHFYFAHLHPYYDGNGRVSRLLHIWFLLQKGYGATLLTSMSEQILKTKNQYYSAFEKIEKNWQASGILDPAPFLLYFAENVYKKLKFSKPSSRKKTEYQKKLEKTQLSQKQAALYKYALAQFSDLEFSTKDLQKAYSNAAYATIRDFVIKFEKLGILEKHPYSNRPKYKFV
ncbi:MAG: Fic family protein [Enterococcus sp.]|nr:Fic family protein [Enterococcus sp.]